MRRLWDLVWRPLVGLLVALVLAWAAGLATPSALLLGVAVALGVSLVERLELDPDVRWVREHGPRRSGARGEVQDLAWAMTGRDGRVGERALRALRTIAAGRVARNGVSLTDPEHDGALRDLVGARAHRTLTTTTSPLPSLRDVRHTVDVLERLGTTRPPATDPASSPQPEPFTPGRTVR
ncbi:hypothetical protein ACGIF2_10415 [Cellulomonas sp. P22]|uniref:hypothetical protein n=1 Tax=Cellulomonas sp. P22 TaxID=3373189 RepID=UPI00379932F4